MSDSTPDLFGLGGDEDADEFDQGGPDLFGTEPDELILAHEPVPVASEVDLDEDEMDEIPIDPDDPEAGTVTEDDDPEAGTVTEDPERDPAEPDPAEPDPAEQPADGQPADGQPADGQPADGQPADGRPAARQPPASPAPNRPEAPLALYRRYRPDTFDEVIGQDHVTQPLRRALANNRVNHAYLFSGPRGCGKTTSARILARCLNCEQGPTPEPCGVCHSCVDLARGGPGSIDVIEMDAATHGLVDDARSLRERAFFAPVHSRYKIYIIDEAHMVTPQGFNALLKLVEEPPPHVKFIFATTEPEKVLGTIKSRTHHYPFRLVPPKVLAGYLESLCREEGVDVDRAVLPLVVRAGAGSVRDALSVLDQLLGAADEHGVSYAQAAALLGYTPETLLDEMMDAFAAGDAQGVFACVDKIIEVGQDPRRFAEDLLRRLRDLIIVAAVPDALTTGLVDVAGDQAQRLTVQARGLGAGELTRAAEVIAKGLTDMRGTTAPRLHLELMCARVLLPGADVDARGVHARLDRLERRLNMVGDAQPGPRGAGGDASPLAREEPPAAPRQGPRGEASGPGEREQVSSGGWASDWQPSSPGGRAGYDARGGGPQETPRLPAPGPDAEPQRRSEPQPGREPQHAPERQRAREPERAPERAPEPPAPEPPAPEPGAPEPGAPEPGAPGSLDTAGVRRMWPQVLEAVKGRRRVTWIVLSQNAQVHQYADGVLTLAMSNAGARESFGRGGSTDILRESLIEVLGVAPTIDTVVAGGEPRPPSAGGERRPPSAGPEPRPPAQTREPGPPAPAEASRPATPSATPSATSSATSSASSSASLSRAPERGTPSGSRRPRRPEFTVRGRSPQARPPDSAEPPPEWEPGDPEDDERPTFAALARENIHRAAAPPPKPAEQSRDDADLDSSDAGVDDLIRKELGAELISEDAPDA